MDGREKRHRIEINALQVSAGSISSENGRHDHGAQNLPDQFIEDLRDADSSAVESDGREIKDSRKENLGAKL